MHFNYRFQPPWLAILEKVTHVNYFYQNRDIDTNILKTNIYSSIAI